MPCPLHKRVRCWKWFNKAVTMDQPSFRFVNAIFWLLSSSISSVLMARNLSSSNFKASTRIYCYCQSKTTFSTVFKYLTWQTSWVSETCPCNFKPHFPCPRVAITRDICKSKNWKTCLDFSRSVIECLTPKRTFEGVEIWA